MNVIKKKLTIAGVAVVTVLTLLTACTGNTEKSESGEEVEEELSKPESTGSEETAGDAGSKEVPETEDADAQNADSKGSNTEGSVGEETEVNGMIEKAPEDGDNSFVIAKLVTEQINGVDIIGTDENDTKITVVYSDDTVFVKQTVRGSGENAEETEGSAADLKEGFTVEMKGSYDSENVFLATDVKIVEVIL